MSDDTIPDVNMLSYGPVQGETSHDTNYGPAGNKLKPYQIAISPSLAQQHGLKLYDWVDVGGQPRQVADWSYVKPGQPTNNTVEVRDVPDVKTHTALRVMTPDEVASKGLPGPDTQGEFRPPRVEPSLPASAPGDNLNPADPMIPLNGIPDMAAPDDTGDVQSVIDQVPPEALMASTGEPTDAAMENASAAVEDGALGDADTSGDEPPVQAQSAVQQTTTEDGHVPPPSPTQRQTVIKTDGPLKYFSDGTILDSRNNTISWKDPAGNMWTYGKGMDKPIKIASNTQGHQRSPEDIFTAKAAEHGIIPSDYDTHEAFMDAAKSSLGADVPKLIVSEIMDGTAPPTLQGLYRYAAPVRAEFARVNKDLVAQGKPPFNLTDAMMDYQAVQKHLTALNSNQQLRLTQSAKTAFDSLDIIDNLASQWKGGGFPLLNRANLILAANGANGPQAQSLATQLQGQISDLTFELGNVYMGGNTPTDQSLKLATKNLSADWSEPTLHDMINLSRRNLQIRLNSMKQVGAAGLTTEGQARYGGQNLPAAPSHNNAGVKMIHSQADYDALPSGAKYTAMQNGTLHSFTKP